MLHIHVLNPANTTSYQLLDFREKIRESHNILIQTCFPNIYVLSNK